MSYPISRSIFDRLVIFFSAMLLVTCATSDGRAKETRMYDDDYDDDGGAPEEPPPPRRQFNFPARAGTIDLVTTLAGEPPGPQKSILQQNELPPDTYTLKFGVEPPPHPFATQALISWKVRGQQVRRIISVSQGAVISSVAEGVSVDVQDVSGALLAAPSQRLPYKVSAQLARGSRPTIQQPPILVTTPATNIVPPALGTIFDVPQDAGVISFFVVALPIQITNPSDVVNIQIVQSDGTALLGGTTAPLPGGWIPLMPGAVQVQVLINALNAPTSVTANVIWGIEG